MSRRRPPAPDPAAAPVQLLRARLSDWTTELDLPPADWDGTRAEYLMVLTARRRSEARAQWEAKHGRLPD